MIIALSLAAALATSAVLPCSNSTCPPLRAFESVACSSGICTGPVPTTVDFEVGSGLYLDLGQVSSYALTVCADSGQTLVGAGTMHVYVINPWTPALITRDMALDLSVAQVTNTMACGGAACRCVTWPDQASALGLPRKLRIVPSGVTVSGGNLSVYPFGALRATR